MCRARIPGVIQRVESADGGRDVRTHLAKRTDSARMIFAILPYLQAFGGTTLALQVTVTADLIGLRGKVSRCGSVFCP